MAPCFGYIFEILYSNIYRNIFYEHLQIDFPKIIFVKNTLIFKNSVNSEQS
ncbi:type ISP restriction/modification enzyme (plasmid) [Borreliella burgdorferi]|uniref:type ISP restriction/modification enzyme n=1 Tax=Borreliella burgdorferi TaxID=139 RepID=UPI0001949159|nr:adenine specific DNA methyltransferase [Borreliella burgdorferi 64b]